MNVQVQPRIAHDQYWHSDAAVICTVGRERMCWTRPATVRQNDLLLSGPKRTCWHYVVR